MECSVWNMTCAARYYSIKELVFIFRCAGFVVVVVVVLLLLSS
jgi:hypothetical protein